MDDPRSGTLEPKPRRAVEVRVKMPLRRVVRYKLQIKTRLNR